MFPSLRTFSLDVFPSLKAFSPRKLSTTEVISFQLLKHTAGILAIVNGISSETFLSVIEEISPEMFPFLRDDLPKHVSVTNG